jgi:hypothetical protein
METQFISIVERDMHLIAFGVMIARPTFSPIIVEV